MNRAIPCGRFYIAQVQKWAVDWVEVEKWCKNLTYKVSDTAFAVNYKSSGFKVKPWLGMCHMTPVSNQYECKLEVLPLNLPTGHPLTFSPLLSDGSDVTRAVSRNVIQLAFPQARLQLCCSVRLPRCSQLPQIKICLRIHKLPCKKSEASNWVINHSSLIFKSSCVFYIPLKWKTVIQKLASNLCLHFSWEIESCLLHTLTWHSWCQRRADALLKNNTHVHMDGGGGADLQENPCSVCQH